MTREHMRLHRGRKEETRSDQTGDLSRFLLRINQLRTSECLRENQESKQHERTLRTRGG